MPIFGTFISVVGGTVYVSVSLGTTTGVVLADLVDLEVVQNGQAVLDPVADLGLALIEVASVSQPGKYSLQLLPSQAGSLAIRFTYGILDYEYILSVNDSVAVDPGFEGEYTVTVTNGATVVEAAVVRVFNAAGALLVARGVTDALGHVIFTLPVGTYQVRVSKEGIDFTSQNPTFIVVTANDYVAPILDELFPLEASIGDTIALTGSAFTDTDMEVIFGTGATVVAGSVAVGLDALIVEIPAGLTDTIIPVQVQKPDPNDLPGGRLISNTLTLVLV